MFGVCVFLCLCCPVYRERLCDELLARPRSPTVCKMIKTLRNQPYAPKWKQEEGLEGDIYIYIPGREADHSPPTSAEIKNTWIYTSTSPYVLMA
jgi:hypothetical protein